MKEIRLGTIGTGSIVHHILDGVNRTEGITLKAVYSRSEEKGKKLLKQYGADRVYTDLEGLLQDPDVNCIYIASPNNLHYEYAKRALLYGKHVICEKPFCSREEQLTELISLAKEKKLFLVDATPTAFLPNFEILKKELSKIGRIRLVICNYSQYSSRYDILREQKRNYPSEQCAKTVISGAVPNVFLPEYAGGCLMDINYYNIYFAAALFGTPKNAVYYPNICATGADTSGIVILQYPDFVFEGAGAKDTWGVNSAQIEGEDGYIYVENGSNGIEKLRVVTRGETVEYNVQTEEMPGETNRYYYEVKGVTNLLLTEQFETVYEKLEITRKTIAVIEQLRLQADILFPGD